MMMRDTFIARLFPAQPSKRANSDYNTRMQRVPLIMIMSHLDDSAFQGVDSARITISAVDSEEDSREVS